LSTFEEVKGIARSS